SLRLRVADRAALLVALELVGRAEEPHAVVLGRLAVEREVRDCVAGAAVAVGVLEAERSRVPRAEAGLLQVVEHRLWELRHQKSRAWRAQIGCEPDTYAAGCRQIQQVRPASAGARKNFQPGSRPSLRCS